LFERLAIDVLSQCGVSVATRILRISWDEAWRRVQRAIRRGRARTKARLVCRIGVDEKAAAKGHRYLALVCDLDEGTVEHIAEDRKQESLDGLEAMAMDMWPPYIQATLAKVPNAADKVVFDRFPIMGYVGKAVDTVRKQDPRERRELGDETLNGRKYLWLYSRENVPERRRHEFATLRRQELTVGRAWPSKRRCVVCGSTSTRRWKVWKRWYFWATHSRLVPIRKATETVRRHIDNILTDS